MVSKIKKHENDEEKFIRLFNLGFEQVVAPAIESLEEELKLEITGLKKEMGGLKKEMKRGFKQVNTKIDSNNRRTDNLAAKIGDHEKRIKNLETKRQFTA